MPVRADREAGPRALERKLGILMLEDSSVDAELSCRELRRAGLSFSARRVETEADFREAVSNHPPDIILADYNLPSFNGMEALVIARDECPDVPFVFVSGAIGEDLAIEAMRLGATDYVLKDRLSRLKPVVERAMQEVDGRFRLGDAYQELRLRIEDLQLVNMLNDSSNSGVGFKKICGLLSREAKRIFQCYGAHVYLFDPDGNHLSFEGAGLPRHFADMVKRIAGVDLPRMKIRLELGEGGIYDQILEAGRPVITNDEETIRKMMASFTQSKAIRRHIPAIQKAIGIKTVISAPLVSQGEILGLLDMSRAGPPFVKSDLDRILPIIDQLTVILRRRQAEEELTKSVEQLQAAFGGIIEVVARMSEMKDPYTAGHQKRVGDMALTISRELGKPKEFQKGIFMAGQIHDLGKFSIPAEILTKSSTLNQFEMELIRTHSSAGFEILKEIKLPWPVATAVLQHHERMDGSGYPGGLTGDNIIPEARIIAVSDVVEAMSSHRPYRPALGIEAALEEVSRGRGILYDADVVDVCTGLGRRLHETLQ